jgi:hypothetical protein
MESYRRRYLQLFDQVAAQAESARQQLDRLPREPAYRALARLSHVPALGSDPRPELQRHITAVRGDLFPEVARATVMNLLRHWPEPPAAPLTLANAADWLARSENGLAGARQAVQTALREKAALLRSPALRQRLVQGQNEAFIAGLLAAAADEVTAVYLEDSLGCDPVAGPDPVALLNRYLKQIRLRKLALADFNPGKRTMEAADVDGVVADFRRFLLAALAADGDEDELAIVELE